MLYAGSDDGVYRLEWTDKSGATGGEQILDAGRVMRVTAKESVPGLLAASETGLYYSQNGESWVDLGVPEPKVYAVAVSPDGGRLYAGTRPAHVYKATIPEGGLDEAVLEWSECDGFQSLPSRDEWHTPRHEDLAQVRSLVTHPAMSERLVAAVEVGGVHVSEDGGVSWQERRDGVADDVHELVAIDESSWIAATGFGAYRTDDAGLSWHRLDVGLDQRYVRSTFHHDGVTYFGAANGPSTTWTENDEMVLVTVEDGDREIISSPRPEAVAIGWTVIDDVVVGACHDGSLIAADDAGWRFVGTVPTPGAVRGRYLPLTWFSTA